MGEDAVSAPDRGSLAAVYEGAVPAVAVLEVADTSFDPGSPLDELSEPGLVFVVSTDLPWLPFSRYGNGFDVELFEFLVYLGLPVAAISGHLPRRPLSTLLDSSDCRGQLRPVCGIAFLDGVVEYEAVLVIDDLGLVTELDRLTHTALDDRVGLRVVQAHQPVAESGLLPASRCRVWAAIRPVRSMIAVSSLTARRSRPRADR